MKRTLLGVLAVVVVLLVVFVGYVVITNRPLPQNEHDVLILERTLVLLASGNSWSKEDNRTCDPAATRLSLYCALNKASIEITGEFHHRAASLQAVRNAIDEIRPSDGYEHRLQDFNNAPDVTLETVHQVLHRAIDDLRSKSGSGK